MFEMIVQRGLVVLSRLSIVASGLKSRRKRAFIAALCKRPATVCAVVRIARKRQLACLIDSLTLTPASPHGLRAYSE